MKYLFLLLPLAACAATREAPAKPDRGTLPQTREVQPAKPMTHFDSLNRAFEIYKQNNSQIELYEQRITPRR